MTNTYDTIQSQIAEVIKGRQSMRSLRISAMGRRFYWEGGHDEVTLGEMIFSCIMIIDAE